MSVDRRLKALREAKETMLAVRRYILEAVAGKSAAELLAPPPDGGWCAAEILDHIGTSERKLVKGLERRAKGEPVKLPLRAWFYRLPMGIAFGEMKVKAPGPVRPRAACDIDPAAVIEGLADSRKRLLALADELGEDRFSRLLFPHFILGRFDGLDWFVFLGKHEGRHLAQLRRTLQATAAAAA